jgi:ABC-type Fe3+ transport system permease subunit
MSAPYVALLSMCVLVMCFWGLTTTRFKDNWLQWLGMWGVIGATISVFLPDAKTVEAFGIGNAVLFALSEIQGREVLMRLGVLSFALGNAVKIWKAAHRKQPPSPPTPPKELDYPLMHRVRGGSK